MTDKTILKSEHGVTLTKVELRGNGVVVERAFSVSTKRESGTQNFSAEQEAQDYYAEEVKRCSGD